MRGGKRQAGGLLPRSGKATRSGAANPVGTAVHSATIEVAGGNAEWRQQTLYPLGQSPK